MRIPVSVVKELVGGEFGVVAKSSKKIVGMITFVVVPDCGAVQALAPCWFTAQIR